MAALTFSTGVVDAACFLGLYQVFTANMTGNILLLGIGLVDPGYRAIGPLVALVAFLVGAVAAGAAMRGVPAGWTSRATLLVGAGAAVVAIALIPLAIARAADDRAGSPPILIATALLGIAMGVQAGVARHIAVAEVNTLVVTWTLVGLAYESAVGADGRRRWPRRVLAVGSLLTGAIIGAALLQIDIAWPLVLAAVVVAAVATTGAITHRGGERAGGAS